jgi:hypothetical protein
MLNKPRDEFDDKSDSRHMKDSVLVWLLKWTFLEH